MKPRDILWFLASIGVGLLTGDLDLGQWYAVVAVTTFNLSMLYIERLVEGLRK